jgi:hypothetical protein
LREEETNADERLREEETNPDECLVLNVWPVTLD